MVRLKREMEGLDPDPRRTPPAWQGVEGLRSQVEAPARAALRRFLRDDPSGLLSAGLPPSLVVELAMLGWSITVVEADPQVVRALQSAVIDHGLMRKVSIIQKELGHASFEPSAFEAVALMGVLERYPSPENVLRKAVRELKMGGRLFATALVRPEGASTSRIRGAASSLRRRLGGESREHAVVDLEPMLAELGRLAKVDCVERSGGLVPVVAEALAPLRGVLGSLAERAVRAASDLTVPVPSALGGATLVWVEARKELGFGRVFTQRKG